MNTLQIILSGLAAAALATSSVHAAKDPSEFAKKAARGGLMEVQAGQLAASNAKNESVREFGQKMVADHSKANAQLTSIARENNIELPQQMGEKQQAMIERLRAAEGADFDRAYMEHMVEHHTESVKLFEAQAEADDSPFAAFAKQTLPTLRSHLDMAQGIHKNLK